MKQIAIIVNNKTEIIMEKLSTDIDTHKVSETISRSVIKTVSYRITIVILDFICIYLFTGKVKIAIGFTIVSNVYTTVFYYLHERIWDKIKWGKRIFVKTNKEKS